MLQCLIMGRHGGRKIDLSTMKKLDYSKANYSSTYYSSVLDTLDSKEKIVVYSLANSSAGSRVYFYLQGSNDNSSWTDIASITNTTGGDKLNVDKFAYRYYRFKSYADYYDCTHTGRLRVVYL